MLISVDFLSRLPKVFGPIFNIRFWWKSLTYKILSGLLQHMGVPLSHSDQIGDAGFSFHVSVLRAIAWPIMCLHIPTEQDNSLGWYTAFL